MSHSPLVVPVRSDKLSMNWEVKSLVHRVETEFQLVEIYDTTVFGRVLLLDGHIQLADFDEKAYHESLVQIPLMGMESPRKALIVGGGDGGVLRELVKHASFERIDMVEIDAGVIEACRAHMPNLSAGAYDDPRVNLIIGDAFPFVKNSTEKYDLVVLDSTDTYEDESGELSEMLFTEEFYGDVRNLLSEQGMAVTQADNLIFCPYSLEHIQGVFAKVFPRQGSYQALVPSFGGYSGFAWASLGSEPSQTFNPKFPMTYLNETTHRLAFTPLNFA